MFLTFNRMGGFSRNNYRLPRLPATRAAGNAAIRRQFNRASGVRTPNVVNTRKGGRGSSSFFKQLAGDAALAALSAVNPTLGAAAGLASSVYGATRYFTSKSSGKKKAVGVDQAYYAGKFSKRKLTEPMITKCAKKGFAGTIEQGGSISDAHCVYIGHSTCATATMAFSGAIALLRAALSSIDLDVQSPDDNLPLTGTWTIRIQYVNPTDATAEVYTTTMSSANSLNQIGRTLAVEFARRANIAPIASGFRWKANSLTLTDGNGAIMLSRDLSKTTITFYGSSSLKVQNASHVVTTGDEDDNSADDVNNVPLVGKGYYGNGAGMYWRSRWYGTDGTSNAAAIAGHGTLLEAQYNFYGNAEHGLIAAKAGDALVLQEPPLKSHFANVTKTTGGQMIQPGMIKSSTLTTTKTLTFNKFWESLRITPVTEWTAGTLESNGTSQTKCTIGRYHTFALEKQLHSSTDNIVVRAEVNYKYGAFCTLKKHRVATHKVVIKNVNADLTTL